MNHNSPNLQERPSLGLFDFSRKNSCLDWWFGGVLGVVFPLRSQSKAPIQGNQTIWSNRPKQRQVATNGTPRKERKPDS